MKQEPCSDLLIAVVSGRDSRLMPDREVHRVSDETHSMGDIMKFSCDVRVAATDRNDRMKYCRHKPSAFVSSLNHLTLSIVLVVLDDYSVYSAEMEVPQHVAR